MTKTCAVVYIVGVEQGAYQLLKNVIIFVGGFGTGISGNCIATIGLDDLHQLVGDQIKGLVPARLPPDRHRTATLVSVGPDQRSFDAARMPDIIRPEATFHTKHAIIGRRIERRFHRIDIIVIHIQDHLTTDAAIGAGRSYTSIWRDQHRPPLTQGGATLDLSFFYAIAAVESPEK